MKTCTAQEFCNELNARLHSGDDLASAVVGVIRSCGPLRAVRVSSAQARGAAKRYAYWGAVRYAIKLSADGQRLICAALERASSDRRSLRLAESDAEALAESEGRVETQHLGGMTPRSVAALLGYKDAAHDSVVRLSRKF